MPRWMAICLISMSMPLLAKAQEAYLCVAEKASGFSFNKNAREWQHARFNVQDQKYLLTSKGGKWEWKEFGRDITTECSAMNEFGFVSCDDIDLVTFNRNSLRF